MFFVEAILNYFLKIATKKFWTYKAQIGPVSKSKGLLAVKTVHGFGCGLIGQGFITR